MLCYQIEQVSPGSWFYDVRDQLKWHIYQRSLRAFERGDAARDAITTPEQLADYQQKLRAFYIESLGGLPPMDTPLEPQVVGTLHGDGFRVEKLIYQSRPRHYVTANLYLPDGLAEPRGAVLFLCGHAAPAKAYPEYQSVCQALTLAGLVVLAQDPIGQGERYSYYDPALKSVTIGECCPDHDYAGAQCAALGDNLARYFLHDAMRSIDYLCSRTEVDPQRIGVTGNSGGGTQSSMLMLADPRLAAAAPGTFIMNRESYLYSGGAQDAEQIWPGFTAAGYDHEDILLAMAPKPVRVLAVTEDFFPIEGTRRTVARCKRIWEQCGNGADIDLVADTAGHAYTPPLRRAAVQFFSRHLLGQEVEIEDARIQPFEPKELWCTRSGQVRGEIEGAEYVHEANKARLNDLVAARHALTDSQREERALSWLNRIVHKERTPCDLNPRTYHETIMDDLRVKSVVWWAQEGLLNHGRFFRALHLDGHNLPVTLALWEGGTTNLRAHQDWIRTTCHNGHLVCVLDVSGSGVLLPHSLHAGIAPEEFYGVLHKLADDLTWLDDHLAALRIYDVLRALTLLEHWPGATSDPIALYAHGRAGVYGVLASFLDARIQNVQIVEGMRSYGDWAGSRYYNAHNIKTLILRGMLRYFDLPDFLRYGEP
jgi:hypothetical protein